MPRPAYAYIAISVVKTNSMKKLIALYRHFSDKRYSTIAGTLVYFLLMSIAPTLLWMALIVGRIDIGNFVSGTMFDAIEPFISYLNKAAQEAASGAGIVLLVTSLYSSANFFCFSVTRAHLAFVFRAKKSAGCETDTFPKDKNGIHLPHSSAPGWQHPPPGDLILL